MWIVEHKHADYLNEYLIFTHLARRQNMHLTAWYKKMEKRWVKLVI